MQYWHNNVTEKSWQILQQLKKEFNFILIGGWATYLWTRQMKSKDIDIIVDFSTLEYIKKKYKLKKNDNLRKYEIIIDEIDIDIYVAYYSKLALAVEKIGKATAKIEGFRVVQTEALLILKQGAELDRGHSEKGEKDRIDIISILINAGINFSRYRKLAPEGYSERLSEIIRSFSSLEYIGLNPRQYKLKKQELIRQLQSA